jgi:osmotically-inducible protein OsmY
MAMRDEGMSRALRDYIERATGPFGRDVSLTCDGGVVTLDGVVRSRTHAEVIAGLVEAQDGVDVVVDRLRVASQAAVR